MKTWFGVLQDILSRLPIDVEHVIASLVQIPKVDSAKVTEQRLNYIIALKHTLELVPSLIELFDENEDPYFQVVRTVICNCFILPHPNLVE